MDDACFVVICLVCPHTIAVTYTATQNIFLNVRLCLKGAPIVCFPISEGCPSRSCLCSLTMQHLKTGVSKNFQTFVFIPVHVGLCCVHWISILRSSKNIPYWTLFSTTGYSTGGGGCYEKPSCVGVCICQKMQEKAISAFSEGRLAHLRTPVLLAFLWCPPPPPRHQPRTPNKWADQIGEHNCWPKSLPLDHTRPNAHPGTCRNQTTRHAEQHTATQMHLRVPNACSTKTRCRLDPYVLDLWGNDVLTPFPSPPT